MNRDEAMTLARLVRSLRPQQTWDDATPQAWALMLDDVRVIDAQAAVKNLMTAAKYVDPPAIVAEVRRLRDARLNRAGVEIPPFPGDPDDVAAEIAWRRDWQQRIADGELATVQRLPPARPLPHLENVFRRPTTAGLDLSDRCETGDHHTCHHDRCQCTCHGRAA